MVTLNPITDSREAMRRIVFLGGAMVGCGSVCSCRVMLALTLTDDQMSQVEALARKVQFEGADGGVTALREIIGDEADDFQKGVMDQIAETPVDAEYLRSKNSGGQAAAAKSLKALGAAMDRLDL